jgi:subtilisin family serine protease
MRSATLLALLPLAIAAPFQNAKRDRPAPVVVPRGGNAIDGKYIVRMKADAISASVESAISSIKADADYTYSTGFNGFAASIEAEELEKLRDDPNVDYIEQDAVVTISATQEDAPWGLARISSAKPGGTTYTYDESAGEGVCAYSLDTGVDIEHPEFEGRAIWAKNFAGGSDKDGQGHGTHTAGTMASKTYGVAKKAKILAVKVLDDNGSGSNSGIIAGMEYVVKDAPQRDCPKGAVVNMSLGGGFSQAINDAAAGITGAGIFLAVAAGNDASNSAQYSPASEKSACTVGATDAKDALADFSNFGQVVDILAPGVGVLSTVPGGKTEEMDGTSMASPHIAGLAAYLLGTGEKVEGLCDTIAKTAIMGAISNVPNGTVNALANNGNQ